MGLMSGIYANGGPGSTLPPSASRIPNPAVTGMDSVLGRIPDTGRDTADLEALTKGDAMVRDKDLDKKAEIVPGKVAPRRQMKKVEEAVLGKEI